MNRVLVLVQYSTVQYTGDHKRGTAKNGMTATQQTTN